MRNQFNEILNNIGKASLVTRSPRTGAEHQLLEAFLSCLPFKPRRGTRLSLFRQPKLNSGFPDAVIVLWSPAAMTDWKEARSKLTTQDLRVVQFFLERGPVNTNELRQILGRKPDAVVDRLLAAGLIRAVRGLWQLRALNRTFAVRDIIAIEAKITDWSSALQQATRNTWFASQSFILMPHAPRRTTTLERAKTSGIGIWTYEGKSPSQILAAETLSLPRSYASWLFNEWVWQSLVQETGSFPATESDESDINRVSC